MKQKLRYKDTERDVRVGDEYQHTEGKAFVREITADWQVLIQFESPKIRPNFRLMTIEDFGAVFFKPQAVKPPIGIPPRFIWIAQRVEEIRAAIERYEEAKLPVPPAWRFELQALVGSALVPPQGLAANDFDIQYIRAASAEQLQHMKTVALSVVQAFEPFAVEVEGSEVTNQVTQEVICVMLNNDYGPLIAFLLNNSHQLLKEE